MNVLVRAGGGEIFLAGRNDSDIKTLCLLRGGWGSGGAVLTSGGFPDVSLLENLVSFAISQIMYSYIANKSSINGASAITQEFTWLLKADNSPCHWHLRSS